MLTDSHLRSFWLTLFARGAMPFVSQRNNYGHVTAVPGPISFNGRDPYLVHDFVMVAEVAVVAISQTSPVLALKNAWLPRYTRIGYRRNFPAPLRPGVEELVSM